MTKVIGSPDVSGSADAGFADTVLQGWGVRVTMRRVALSYRRMSIPAERWIADHASPEGWRMRSSVKRGRGCQSTSNIANPRREQPGDHEFASSPSVHPGRTRL